MVIFFPRARDWLILAKAFSLCLWKVPISASTSKQVNVNVMREEENLCRCCIWAEGVGELELHGSVSKRDYDPELNMEFDFAFVYMQQ